MKAGEEGEEEVEEEVKEVEEVVHILDESTARPGFSVLHCPGLSLL